MKLQRPRIRRDCAAGDRPCPWVGCRYHLYLDAGIRGALKFNFPHLEPWEIPASCALDLADRGGLTLEQTGELMNLTRERVRQVESMALAKLEAASDLDWMPGEPLAPEVKVP